MTDVNTKGFIISSATFPDDPSEGNQESVDGFADASGIELRHGIVPIDAHGQRLDVALGGLVPEFSRSYLQQLIAAGAVQLNGLSVSKSAARVRAGQALGIELRPTLQSQAFKPETMPIEVVFEDAFLLIVNKPAGLVVHPAPGNWSGTLLNGLLARDPQCAALPRAGIVHRLDKDTSGLMVVARQRQTMDQLVEMIAARAVSRNYLALAHNAWQGSKTRRVDHPVGRDPKNRLRMAVVDLEKNSGKTAATDITLLQSAAGYCLVQCKLHTGRTHQIRVHMSAVGHPLVADELYGGKHALGLQRQALHAFRLAFKHPANQLAIQCEAVLPHDMKAAVNELGLK